MLPTELRLHIWKLAASGSRIFEPRVKLVTPRATTTPNVTLLLAPNQQQPNNIPARPLIQLAKQHKLPALRQICRESRQVSDEIGGFEFGLYGDAFRSNWFEYAKDVVLIHSDMMDKLHHMNLERVQQLAFLNSKFQTEERCQQILEKVNRYTPRCRYLLFCFLSDAHQENTSNHATILYGRVGLRRLRDDDLVGHYTLPGRDLPDGPVQWKDLRCVILKIWAEQKESLGLEIEIPKLVGKMFF